MLGHAIGLRFVGFSPANWGLLSYAGTVSWDLASLNPLSLPVAARADVGPNVIGCGRLVVGEQIKGDQSMV